MKSYVYQISRAEERHYDARYAGTMTKGFWHLNIYSKKSADILNAIIQSTISCLHTKKRYQRYYSSSSYDPDSKIGGGVIVKTRPEIVMTTSGEVCIIMYNVYSISSYVHKANSASEILSTIKEKFGYALKKMWNAHSLNDKLELFTDPKASTGKFEVSFSEYRLLYETLMERDAAKIKKNYTAALRKSIIGERVDDQFALAAIDMLETQIKELDEKMNKSIESLNNKCNEEVKDIKNRYDVIINEVKAKNEEERKKIKIQIDELAKNMVTTNTDVKIAANE